MIKKEYLLYTDKVDSNKDIMLISDFHFSDPRSLWQISKILSMAEAENVSHIIIPGDLYNGEDGSTYKNSTHLKGFLNMLGSIAPIYYVQGNSEQTLMYLPGFLYNQSDILSSLIHIMGDFHIGIKTEDMSLADKVNVVGFGLNKGIYNLMDKYKPEAIACHYGKAFSKFQNSLSKENFNILVCHDPMIGEALAYYGMDPDLFDLIITGHRHGGEYPDDLKSLLALSSEFMAEAYPKYQGGFYDIEGLNTKMFVGNGITEYVLDNKNLEETHDGVVDFIRIRKI